MRTLVAGKLILEPQVASHAEEMFALLCDAAIYEHENEPPASLEWLRERFTRLESRESADGRQLWLNWVLRLPTAGLIGYAQATVFQTGRAAIAYVLASKYWGRGLAGEACQAMIAELAEHYRVVTVYAIFKRRNLRSARLLERLGFAPASAKSIGADLEPDELLMLRDVSVPE
jgi:ribosomal-protein-alanine N-acetyltransferase